MNLLKLAFEFVRDMGMLPLLASVIFLYFILYSLRVLMWIGDKIQHRQLMRDVERYSDDDDDGADWTPPPPRKPAPSRPRIPNYRRRSK